MLGQRLDNVALELLTVKSNRKSLPSIGKRISSYFSRDLRSFESQKSSRSGKVLPRRAPSAVSEQKRSSAFACRGRVEAEESWKLSLSSSFAVLNGG